MLVNAFLFDMSDPDDPKVVMVQKVDQGDKWALPGGKSQDGEENPVDVCYREISEEVGLPAAFVISEHWDELEIDRGNYKQHVFVAPFSKPLRKKGMKELTSDGDYVERLGPPTWVSFNDICRGIVTVGKEFYEVYPSHLNAIHEALSSLADFHPEIKPYAKATKVYAWDKNKG